MNITAMLRAHFAPRDEPLQALIDEDETEPSEHGELTMTSLTRRAASSMMQALQAETDMLRADVVAEIEFSKNTIAAFMDAERKECEQIDAEAEQRKGSTRKMYEELLELERRRIQRAEHRLRIIDGQEDTSAAA